MRISQVAVRRPVATLMVFVGIVVLGIVSYRQLPVQLIPDITVPAMGVYLGKPGASASENLEELTKPVEGIIAELPRVKTINSWTGSWGTWIEVEFETGTDIRFTAIDLQERLVSFQQDLDDRRTAVEVYPFSTDSFKNFLMEIIVEGPKDDEVLSEIVRDKVEPQLKSVSGVAKVEVGGVSSPTVAVDIVPEMLAGYGLAFESVFARIQSATTNDTYLGRLETPGETHYVRLDMPVRNTRELARVAVDDRGVVELQDVALIDQGASLDEWVYRSNGRNAVGLRVDREEGENLIEVAKKVRTRVEEINEQLPAGVAVRIRTDIADIVQGVVDEVRNLALLGALLALLVPLVFFRSWRIAAIIFFSVPISIIAVFNLFMFFGMSINIFSIIGLALGVGMLVDNSIVVVENCFRLYFGKHAEANEAASIGGDEVGRALLASTLTSCVPFISLFFIEGDFKLFVKEPALALVFPLLISLAVALTLSAMLTAKALQTVVHHSGAAGELDRERAARRLNPKRSRMREIYRYLLKGSLRHRGRVLGIIGLVLAFVWLDACSAIREDTVDDNRQPDVARLYINPPPGSTLSETDSLVAYVEDRLLEHEDIESFGVWFREDHGSFDIKLLESEDRPSGRSLQEIQAELVDYVGELPGGGEVSLRPADRSRGGPSALDTLGDRGQLKLRALEIESLENYAARLIQALELDLDIARAEIVENDTDNLYEANIERERTKLFGVTAQELGQYMGLTRASGQVSSLILKDGEDRTDVILSVADRDTDSVAEMRGFPVYTKTGSTVPFGELTTFRPESVPTDRARSDRQNSLEVEYFWLPGTNTGELTNRIRDIVRATPNPGGVTVEFGGQQQRIDERNEQFAFVLLTGILFIYVVMAAVFESFWIPFTIIATNPLMLIGIVLALALTGLPFEELAAFGVILLNGLAVNNGIVLMDTALRYQREQGYRRIRAVFQAADQRLRPIVMTFLTTTLGLLPLAIFGGEDSNWRPVAVTVVGGLTSATFLTLLVLPCFYMIGDDFVTFARPYWFAFLGTVFRFLERVVNGFAHGFLNVVCIWKWRPLRWPRYLWLSLRRILFLGLWRTPRFVIVVTWRIVRGAWRAAIATLGDAAFLIGQTIRRPAFSHAPSESRSAHDPAREACIPPPPPGGSSAISVTNLHVVYKSGVLRNTLRLLPKRDIPFGHRPIMGHKALESIDLQIPAGLFGLLGPNGAGKTTLMRCMAGLIDPTRGTVRLFGHAHRDAGESLAPLIGYLPQDHGHYDWMTLAEYLEYFAILTSRTMRAARDIPGRFPELRAHLARLESLDEPVERSRAIAQVAESVNLSRFLNERVGVFSGGMRQRAGIARVLLQSPPILIVDEPTAGLDPLERVKLRLLLARLARERTVVFSTHIVEDLEDTCDGIAILDGGRLRYAGSPVELRDRWQGHVWEVPAPEEHARAVRTQLDVSGAHVLFRYAHREDSGWRVLSRVKPTEKARPVTVTLEDALLGTLTNGVSAAGPVSAWAE